MTSPNWQTPKDLGILADGTYFEKQLAAISPPLNNISYQIITGTLPAGVTLSDTGRLYGSPTVASAANGEINYKTSFTVRATNQDGNIADRTFSLMVSGIMPASIEPTSSFLGAFYDGDYCKKQLKSHDGALSSNLSWSLIRGRLPPGITFSSNGVLEGFFYQNRVADSVFAKIGWDKTAWDNFIYDFIKQDHDSQYEFTVELTDGINCSRQTYIMQVIAKDFLSVDNSLITNDTQRISIDRTPRHLPFITTRPQILSEIKPEISRQNTYFAFKFDAVGFDQGVASWDYNIVYEITSLDDKGWDQYGDLENHEFGTGFDTDKFDSSDHPMPLYIGLDSETGWYVGEIANQVEYQKNYEFYVFARPDFVKDVKNYTGYKSKFGLNILGSADETITWKTDSYLGVITNGKMAEIQIEAIHGTGKKLDYNIVGNGGRTPQGVVVLNNGVLSGRPSIECFKYDNDTTIIDGGKTTCDQLYTFTVRAQTSNKSAYSEKTFTIRVNYVNKKPFDNLYLKGFPSANQRRLFIGIMNRQDLFPDNLIYRLHDPDYGKANDLRFLFLPGINTTSMQGYTEVVTQNHYNKTLLFGNIKTAIALDENYNIQYEVVYLEVLDEAKVRDPVTSQTAGSARIIDLTTINKNFYTDNNVVYTKFTPNSLDNMRNRIETQLGYASKNNLPLWMTSPQPDPDNPGQFIAPLGYVQGAVLAYTVPGASSLISYRLKNANFSFNRIPFNTDRYQIDSHLSKNYDLDLKKFTPGEVTSIDKDPSVAEKFRVIGTVDYAVTVDYLDIVGKSVTTLRECIDINVYDDIRDGDTLIFFRKGIFPKSIPGWVDQLLQAGIENYQASIFTIKITNTIVTLSLNRLVKPGDIISVIKSKGYRNKQLFLETYPAHDIVPHWWFLTQPLITNIYGGNDKLLTEHKETTFDKGGTRFINHRTYYTDLDSSAKYIKFPKTGVFT